MIIENEGLKMFLKKIMHAIENPVVSMWKVLSNEELFTLYTNATDIAEKAQIKDYLVIRNVRYAVKKCNGYYTNTSVSRRDLINSAIKGILIAIDKYKPAKGTKLITVINTYVFKVINKVLREDSFTVNIAENAIDDLNRIRRFEMTDHYLISKNYLSKEELIELTIIETKMTQRRYHNAMCAQTHMVSPAEFEQEVMETISDAEHLCTNPELLMMERYDSEERSLDVQRVLEGLSVLDKQVIDLLYCGAEKLSIAQVAAMLNISAAEATKVDNRVRKALKPIAFRFCKPKSTKNTKNMESEM